MICPYCSQPIEDITSPEVYKMRSEPPQFAHFSCSSTDMKKFNVFFTVTTPLGQTETPNTNNPVIAESLEELLRALADGLPESKQFGLRTTGIRIEEIE